MKSFWQILKEDNAYRRGELQALYDALPDGSQQKVRVKDFLDHPASQREVDFLLKDQSMMRAVAQVDANTGQFAHDRNMINNQSAGMDQREAALASGQQQADAAQAAADKYNQETGRNYFNDQLERGIKVGVGVVGAMTAPLWLPKLAGFLLPKLGGLFTKYGLKLAKDVIQKLLNELLEMLKQFFAENPELVPNKHDQLLQMDVQSIIMKAKQTPQDQYAIQILPRLESLAQQQLKPEAQQQKDYDGDGDTEEKPLKESDFQRIYEGPNWASLGRGALNVAKGAGNLIGKGLDMMSPGTPSPTNQGSTQMNRLKQSPQEMNLKTDLQNLDKKCRVVQSEYSNNILQVIQGLIK